MTGLAELSATTHRELRIVPQRIADIAASQHLVNIRANEVGSASCSAPILVSQTADTHSAALSMVCGLQPGKNLLLDRGVWSASYQPTALQTFPLFLMNADNDKGYVVGVPEDSEALSMTEGERLYDVDGNPTPLLRKITAMLEAGIEADLQTRHFLQQLVDEDLLKAVDLVVNYTKGGTQNVQGLQTVNEDKLRALTADQLARHNETGYLVLMHAMLLSTFQLNGLIRQHNLSADSDKIQQIRIEAATA